MTTKTPPPPPPRGPRLLAWATQPLRQWVPFVIPGCDAQLFKIDGAPLPGVPPVDPDYVFRDELVREVAWSVWPHDNGAPMSVALVGPKGSGKTTLIEQIAARANIPVARVNLNVGTTVRHLKGRTAAKEGKTYFVPGVATDAMESGKWLILDEVSGATPPVALCLFPILEPGGAVYLEDSEPARYVERHPDFRVFLTDNTIGAEQEESRFAYGGTNQMNAALLDRIDTTLQVGYLPPEMEEAAVKAKAPGIDPLLLEGMIRAARYVRSNPDISEGFSIRMLVAWARRVAAGYRAADGAIVPCDGSGESLKLAADAAFLRKMRSRVDRDAVSEVIQRLFGG